MKCIAMRKKYKYIAEQKLGLILDELPEEMPTLV